MALREARKHRNGEALLEMLAVVAVRREAETHHALHAALGLGDAHGLGPLRDREGFGPLRGEHAVYDGAARSAPLAVLDPLEHVVALVAVARGGQVGVLHGLLHVRDPRRLHRAGDDGVEAEALLLEPTVHPHSPGVGAAQAVARVCHQQPSDEAPGALRRLGRQPGLRRPVLAVANGLQALAVVLLLTAVGPGDLPLGVQQLEREHPGGPPVHRAGVLAREVDQLWSHVLRRATLRIRLAQGEAREAQVAKLRIARPGQQDVAWLDVPVYDVALVQVLQSCGDARQVEARRVAPLDRAPAVLEVDDLLQGAAARGLLDHVDKVSVLVGQKQADDEVAPADGEQVPLVADRPLELLPPLPYEALGGPLLGEAPPLRVLQQEHLGIRALPEGADSSQVPRVDVERVRACIVGRRRPSLDVLLEGRIRICDDSAVLKAVQGLFLERQAHHPVRSCQDGHLGDVGLSHERSLAEHPSSSDCAGRFRTISALRVRAVRVDLCRTARNHVPLAWIPLRAFADAALARREPDLADTTRLRELHALGPQQLL
mmetsp:Transcript_112654/g.305867  ORF Transcript_112654/g.305867 Transcript_112654/m.305867 type:complete len:545 (-) Transcript_112654:30-1664(-)